MMVADSACEIVHLFDSKITLHIQYVAVYVY
jgi:hypothetical protein